LPRRGTAEGRLAEFFSALSSPQRLKILRIISEEGGKCACELALTLGLHASVAWRHLAFLERVGILASRREGQRVLFDIANREVLRLIELAKRLLEGGGVLTPPPERAGAGMG